MRIGCKRLPDPCGSQYRGWPDKESGRSVLPFSRPDVAPVILVHLHLELARRTANARPRLIPFLVRHVLHLVEAGDGVAHVRGVFQRFLALPGKRELLGGDVVLVFLVQFAHASSWWVAGV